MDHRVSSIFAGEVEQQCKFALLAFQDIQDALRSQDTDRLWYSIQAFLVAAANVSKIFWPSCCKFDHRGKELRELLLVSDDSPLHVRKIRNDFEHFDERIDKWAASSEHHVFVDNCVGLAGKMKGVEVSDCFRNLDSHRMTVQFRGEEYQLRPVVEAIKALHRVAAAKPRRS